MHHAARLTQDPGMRVFERYFLKQGLEANARNNQGQTPLMLLFDALLPEAIMAERVRAYLAAGANPALQDKAGRRARDYTLSPALKTLLK